MSYRPLILSLSLLVVACGAKDKPTGEPGGPSPAASALGTVDARGIIFVGGTPQDMQRQPRVKIGNIAPKPLPAPRPE
jgi:hypothetical protein